MKSTRHDRTPNAVSLFFLLFFISFFLVNLPGCSRTSSAQTDPQADYSAAVNDARTMSAAKITKNLTAITAGNTNLKWENDVPGSRVLVATYINYQPACEGYTSPDGTGCKVGQECKNYGYSSWVTVVPELKNLLGTAPALLRVIQALGLPPPSNTQTLDNTCILELYVSPGDLFRPSPDPEITDQEAELSFPLDGFRKFDDTRLVWSEMPCDTSRCPSCQSGKCGFTTYKNWFDNRKAHVYDLSTPYPWTALGYTYDWGNPTAPHIGLSEFVINPGSGGVPVFIKSVNWTRDYFTN
ncbi:MAG: hypothetical protein A4E57_00484 [Syntrophorhabdaceae bacterium PtaU1.Bin034]|nr:MAG: hypothetical protein A4E57_00484 [Syntrophorhabdaceae bacterium PtaU1.Bin034]